MKKTIAFIAIICIMVTFAVPAFAQYPHITSRGACVMDYDSGEILYQYNGYIPRVPASMTKVMSVYCIYDAISNGEISLDTKVPISSRVKSLCYDIDYRDGIILTNDKVYTVDEMLDVIMVHSANAVTVSLAELIAGSEWEFTNRMNQKAASLGIDAYYVDCCGMLNENKISPVGMATLARSIIKTYPDILSRSSKKSVVFHGKEYKSTNHLFDTYFYPGTDGLKTGTTTAAGYCFCGTAVRNGKRLISVTMASSTTNQRFVDSIELLNYGFSVVDYKESNLFFTDISTFINDVEIPTFVYTGVPNYAVVVAQDLESYGFDLSYIDEQRTLYISYNGTKPITPKIMDYYKNKNGEKAFTIAKDSDIKVYLTDANYELKNVYNTGNYMCIAIDELAKAYSYTWNDESRRADVKTQIITQN